MVLVYEALKSLARSPATEARCELRTREEAESAGVHEGTRLEDSTF